MELTINRTYLERATVGFMEVDGVEECLTLERTPSDPEHPCIAEGGPYRISWEFSHHLNRDCIHVAVPDRIGILIHSGSVVADSKGCPMVGDDLEGVESGSPTLHGGLENGVLERIEKIVKAALDGGQIVLLTCQKAYKP